MVGVIQEVLNGNHSHASQIGENEYVFHAGLITKVNHSCNPNCGIRVNETGAHDYVAIMEIGVNEELTFDYAMRNHIIDYLPKKCMLKILFWGAGLLDFSLKAVYYYLPAKLHSRQLYDHTNKYRRSH